MMFLSSAIFRAYGKLSLSMVVVLVEAGFIIGLDYLFVFAFGGGIRSVATSNIIAGIISSLLGIFLLFKLNAGLNMNLKLFKLDMKATRDIISIGFSALGRALSGALLGLVLNLTIRSLGEDDALAALGAVNRIVIFLVFAIMGVNQALQPVVSYNFTGGQSDRVKQALKYALIYTGIIGIVGSILALFLPQQIVSVFTSDADVLDDAASIFRMQLILFFTAGIHTISATYFQAIGKARMSFFLSVFKQLFILVPLVYFLPRLLDGGVASIWWAFPISDIIAFVVCVLLLKRGVRQLAVSS
jgi:Na+-driven multidrug efflux pump